MWCAWVRVCVRAWARAWARAYVNVRTCMCAILRVSEMLMSEFVHVHVYVCLDAYWTK